MQSGQIIRIGTSWLLAWIGAVSIALAQPAVSLGPDQTACGSAVLNAGNPGASYLWNTGDTTQTLTVTASGQYSVAVTDLNGTGRDTVVVTVLPVPSLQAADATVCGAQSLALSAQHSGNMLVWYGNSALTQFLGTGSPSVQPSASTDYYAQSYTTSFAGTAGIPNNTVYISGGFATIQTGYVFDALSTLIIDSVAVYVNVPNVTLRVDLWGSTNLLIDRRIVTVPATGKQFIDLAFFVPQGNNYKLMLTQITGGTIFRNGNTPYPYPFTLPGVVSIKRHTTTGNDNVTTFSSVFYDWHLSRIACASAVDTASVSVTAIPALVMPNDTIICDGSSFSIQPQNTAGAVNLWETGDTTLALTVTSSGTYSLQSYLAPQCAITDSIRVDFESTPVFSQMSDTVLCGPQALTLTAQHSGSVLAWYRNAAATQLIGSGAPTVQIGGDTAFYVRSFAAQPAGAAGILNDQQYVTGGFTTIQTGYVFDAVSSLVLDSVAVYVNAANTTLRIDLWGSTNALIERRIVTVPGTGKRFVKLGFYVPQGNDYKLMLTQITGGSIFRNGSAAYPYPFTLPGVLRIKRHTTDGSNTITAFSSVFYDWRVSRTACASAVDTLSVDIVPVPSLVMPNDTILCDAASFTIQPQNTAGAVNLWETGDTTLALTVTVPGTYSLQSYLAPQCAITDSIRVDFESTPIFSQLPDTVLCGP
ncbi:MAG: hypothetical protein NW241_13875, partial [Bacteroidia bacterium]|nr:hypothetical protein [Bacteroidia bacterium]